MFKLIVTNKILRGVSFSAQNASKTHCLRGHPFDESNTFYCLRGFRHCRECHRIRSRERDRRRRLDAKRRMRDAVAVIKMLLASATPNRKEHPTMYKAWEQATAFLAAERKETA